MLNLKKYRYIKNKNKFFTVHEAPLSPHLPERASFRYKR